MSLHPSTAAAIAVCCCALITAGLTGCSTVSNPKLSQYEEAEHIAKLGHWVNGLMDEEYLFWDNQEFMKQVGLGQ